LRTLTPGADSGSAPGRDTGVEVGRDSTVEVGRDAGVELKPDTGVEVGRSQHHRPTHHRPTHHLLGAGPIPRAGPPCPLEPLLRVRVFGRSHWAGPLRSYPELCG